MDASPTSGVGEGSSVVVSFDCGTSVGGGVPSAQPGPPRFRLL